MWNPPKPLEQGECHSLEKELPAGVEESPQIIMILTITMLTLGTVLSHLHVLSHLILTTAPCSCCYHNPHGVDQ